MALLKLKSLDNRTFASTLTERFDPFGSGRWGWIAEQVAEEFGCDPDDVSATDDEEDFDVICVDGQRVARLARSYGDSI